jgi:hypothetical protein
MKRTSTSWPSTIPHDLDKALDDLALQRYSKSNADLWGVMQEWLQRHGVQAPKDLPMRPEQTSSDE